MEPPLQELLRNTLLYVVLPVWMLAGFGDWLSHRLQHIEHTAGLKESLIHLMMLAELGPCLLLVLLCEVNALVLVVLVLACIAHEATVWWDLLYAVKRRPIPVVEQWLHSFQLAAPWVSLAGLMLLHWNQARALVGLGPEAADWTLQWKRQPLSPAQIGVTIAAGFVLIALPFLEEAWRCWHSGPARPAARP
jgi:hypothetical protein